MFSRDRGSGRQAKDGEPRRGPRHAARRRERDEFGLDAVDETAEEPTAGIGPYDITEAPAGDRLDLGSLQIPAVDGVDVRVQADAEGHIQQVMLVYGESALQLGVFAAPRSEGIWDEVRADIREQLSSDGVAAQEINGDYGVELRSRVPAGDGLTDIRFVGIDGPRWMVRAVYQGRAAVDPTAAEPLTECLRGLVVDRGGDAMPVREPLPLRLPREVAEHAHEAGEDGPDGANGAQVGPGDESRRRPSPRPRRRG
jgi:Protein of unknown function (DUF3710)